MTSPARWLLGATAGLAIGAAAATLLPACETCESPTPDTCIPHEGETREDVCRRCGGVYHSCQDGKWTPFPCGAVIPGRDR